MIDIVERLSLFKDSFDLYKKLDFLNILLGNTEISSVKTEFSGDIRAGSDLISGFSWNSIDYYGTTHTFRLFLDKNDSKIQFYRVEENVLNQKVGYTSKEDAFIEWLGILGNAENFLEEYNKKASPES